MLDLLIDKLHDPQFLAMLFAGDRRGRDRADAGHAAAVAATRSASA